MGERYRPVSWEPFRLKNMGMGMSFGFIHRFNEDADLFHETNMGNIYRQWRESFDGLDEENNWRSRISSMISTVDMEILPEDLERIEELEDTGLMGIVNNPEYPLITTSRNDDTLSEMSSDEEEDTSDEEEEELDLCDYRGCKEKAYANNVIYCRDHEESVLRIINKYGQKRKLEQDVECIVCNEDTQRPLYCIYNKKCKLPHCYACFVECGFCSVCARNKNFVCSCRNRYCFSKGIERKEMKRLLKAYKKGKFEGELLYLIQNGVMSHSIRRRVISIVPKMGKGFIDRLIHLLLECKGNNKNGSLTQQEARDLESFFGGSEPRVEIHERINNETNRNREQERESRSEMSDDEDGTEFMVNENEDERSEAEWSGDEQSE